VLQNHAGHVGHKAGHKVDHQAGLSSAGVIQAKSGTEAGSVSPVCTSNLCKFSLCHWSTWINTVQNHVDRGWLGTKSPTYV
jgi:hypothetical protein